MNKKACKKIKSIIGFQKDDPISKRTYRGIKSEYQSLSKSDREKYISNLNKIFNS